jgi:hypothetical protein
MDILHVYENRIMKPAEIVQRRGGQMRENNGKDENS